MKKELTIGCLALGVLAAASLQAKTTTIVDGCVFCGGSSTVISDSVPVISNPTSTSGCVFCGSGSSSSSSGTWTSGWTKATSKTTYIVNSEGAYAGTATITTSKISKKGKVTVKVAFKPSVGKGGTSSKTAFTPDEDGTISASWSNVKNIGAVSMTITTDGEVSGTAGIYEFSDEYSIDSDDEEGTFTHGSHTFSVEIDDYELPNDDYTLIDDLIPTEAEIVTSNSSKWNCGKKPSIKYKKIKEDGEVSYELVGTDDESKTNYSGLTLKYKAKKGTFSGSFTVYATNEGSTEKKPKLKKYKFSVSGRISGGSATGVATCKKLKASWPVTIE